MFEKVKRGRYVSVLSDGKFHEGVAQGANDAVLRKYETSDGKTGEKWEVVYEKITALITNIYFKEGDYGENLYLTVEGDEGEATIQLNASQPFGESIMKVLPNIDFEKEVQFFPYAFPSDKDPDKKIRGISLSQDTFKVSNYFYDGKENQNGFPNPPKEREEMTKKDWKRYFQDTNEFLIEYTKENICSKFTDQGKKNAAHDKAIDDVAEDVPF